MGWSLEGVGPPSPSETVPAGFMQRVPTNYTADIEGSRPKVRRWATRKIGSLRTDDIEGARKKEKKTRLQKPDSHDIKDIDGAAPRKYGTSEQRILPYELKEANIQICCDNSSNLNSRLPDGKSCESIRAGVSTPVLSVSSISHSEISAGCF